MEFELDETTPPARPVRTYGRRAQPADDVARTPPIVDTTSLFSPSKKLLSDFAQKSSRWRASLAALGTEDDDEADVMDEDEVKRFRDLLRKDMPGGEAESSSDTADKRKRDFLKTAFSSSSLTPLPSSQVQATHSDPPQPPAHAQAQTGPPAHVLPPSSSPPVVSDAVPKAPSSGPSLPRLSATPPLQFGSDSAEESSPETLETKQGVTTVGKRRAKRLSLGDDDELSGPIHTPLRLEATDNPPSPENVSLGNLLEQAETDDAGLAESDNEQTPIQVRTKIKAPSKRDQDQSLRDIAKAYRERPITLSRPEPEQRPVSTWLQNAAMVLQRPSARAATPEEEIQQFTPSSAPTTGRQRRTAGTKSSPTPKRASPPPSAVLSKPGATRPYMVAASDSQDDDADDEFDLAATVEEISSQEARISRLAAIKQAQLKANSTSRPTPAEDDDDLSIIPDEPPKRAASKALPPVFARAADAGRALNRPPPSKHHLELQMLSGKGSARNPTLTETHVAHAGQRFAHHKDKFANAGARPAGQKKGRDNTISQFQLNQMMLSRHQEQARAIASAEEKRFGQARRLPPKQGADHLTAIVSSSNARVSASDDEDDDDDYDPGDEEGAYGTGDEQVSGDSRVKDSVSSASEDEEGEGAGGEEAVPAPISTSEDEDKENRPPAPSREDADGDGDDDLVPIRRGRAARRVAITSDDEDEPQAAGIADSVPSENEAAVPTEAEDGSGAEAAPASVSFDLGGFGSAGGGFSQLFDATQAAGGAEEEDGLAGLRATPKGFLPTHALLPGVNLSESQMQRDNALIAGEVEAANDTTPVQRRPKSLYLNSQGFFTQTRPMGHGATQHEADANEDADGDELSIPPMSSTQLATSSATGDISSPPHVAVPEPASPDGRALRRLRRRASSKAEDRAAPARSPTPVRNAFDMLRDAQRPSRRATHLVDRALVDEQAEESDEDAGWGFGPAGDEEDGDELDAGYVPELLDDAEMSADEQARQEVIAAAKHREIEQEDDARREAEAKKMAEGHYRHKRRGNEFMSDEEDEEGGPRRLSKKQRRQLRLERLEGIRKREGEDNAFLRALEEDLESDNDFDETPMSPREESPELEGLSGAARLEALRERARLNRTIQLDFEGTYEVATEVVEAPGFSIARSRRTTTTTTTMRVSAAHEEFAPPLPPPPPGRRLAETRSLDNYTRFVRDESQSHSRRPGAVGGVSVVRSGGGSGGRGSGGAGSGSARVQSQPQAQAQPQAQDGRGAASAPGRAGPGSKLTRNGSGAGSVLMDKTMRFM